MRSLFPILFLSCLSAFGQGLQVQTGLTFSNGFVGGRIFSYCAPVNYTNCCAGNAPTNMAGLTVGGNSLRANWDTLNFTAAGKFSLTGQSKRLILTYGSQDLLDTGLQAVSNGTWVIQGSITGWGSSQYYWARATWDRAVAGGGTNVSGWITQTNGIATVLKLQGAANVVSSITNEAFFVDWLPGPR